jgi:hypothetical protein
MRQNTCAEDAQRITLAELVEAVGGMRRDDDLIRDMMLELEEDADWIVIWVPNQNDPVEMAKYYHLRLLADEGFLEVTGRFQQSFRITNAGHDFLALMREAGLWGQIKAKAKAAPGHSLRFLFEIGQSLVREKLREIGVPLP